MPDKDETLELRRRARRRLIGAIALVLALIIVPPWVMDLEPKPVATNLTVEIPRQDSGAMKPPAVVPPPKAAAAPAAAAASAGADKQAGGIPRPPDVSPDTGKAGERPKAESAKATPKPKPEPVARAAPAEPARSDDGAAKRAEAILNAEAYLVPLGAFASKDNVKALEAKLAKAGVKYYTEVVTTPAGEQTRVRAGPFPTKEAAEKSRERLKGLGLSPGAVIARQ
jgi:DedD protein